MVESSYGELSRVEVSCVEMVESSRVEVSCIVMVESRYGGVESR